MPSSYSVDHNESREFIRTRFENEGTRDSTTQRSKLNSLTHLVESHLRGGASSCKRISLRVVLSELGSSDDVMLVLWSEVNERQPRQKMEAKERRKEGTSSPERRLLG